LVLGVHDIEVVIGRNEPKGRFIGIGNTIGALRPFAGIDYHYPCYGARPIDGSSRSILEHTEGINIIRR